MGGTWSLYYLFLNEQVQNKKIIILCFVDDSLK